MADLVTFEPSGMIGTIALRRPEKFNALDIPMLDALNVALDAAEASDARVVLLHGEGKGFCAGGDIGAWAAMSAADFQIKWVRHGHRVFDRLARLRQPTIAVLSGHALGAVSSWRRPAISGSPRSTSSWGCRRLRSAWCLAGPALSAPCAASVLRS